MEDQSLKLTMLQGPRQGETIEFRPGTTIQVGRVVRGNNVNIKDKGISTKHLLIKSEELGKWTIQDLDSSNGTILNGVNLTPLKPIDLRDGDVVKIGEMTSISVSIAVSEQILSQVRGNPRKGGGEATRVSGEGEAQKNVESVKGSEVLENVESEKNGDLSKENVKVNVQKRRGRPRKGRGLASIMENAELGNLEPAIEVQRANVRVTRSRKKKNEDSVIELKDNSESSTMETTAEMQAANERVLRGRKKKQDPVIEVPEIRAEVKEKPTGRRGKASEKLPTKESEVTVENLDLGLKDKEVQVKPCKVEVIEEEELDLLDAEDGGIGANDTDGNKGVEEFDNLREGETEVIDFEKMTMKEWFASMEVNLVKQIVDQTEEMIEEMRTKAERVKEYLIQQKRDKTVIK